MSILFVDLVGFTARADRADPEDVRATLRPYYTCVRRELTRWGGTVEKFIGDAVMATFGAPVAHEDDAERAVRAGLRVMRAIQELNAAEPGLGLSLRAAVTTGEAVVARRARTVEGEGIATGDVVNTAARLQAVAPAGAVVVDEATYRTTRHLVDYAALEPVSVQGKAGPIRVWRAKAARGRYGADPAQATPSPFIGRSHELALLKAMYASRRPRGVGAARHRDRRGGGREEPAGARVPRLRRLAARAGALAARSMPLLRGGHHLLGAGGDRQEPGGDPGVGRSPRGHRQARGGHRRDRGGSHRAGVAQGPLGPPGWRERPRRSASRPSEPRSFAAWRRFLEAVAADRPLVLVFEDVHWAGAELLEFVEHLVDWAASLPFLVRLHRRGRSSSSVARDGAAASETPPPSRSSPLSSRGDGPVDRRAPLRGRAPGRDPGRAPRAGRGKPALRRGVRSHAHGPRDARTPGPDHAAGGRRRHPGPRDHPGRDRRAPRHAAAPSGRRSSTTPPSWARVFWVGALAFMSGLDERAVEEEPPDGRQEGAPAAGRNSSVNGQAEYSFGHLLIRDVAYQQIPRAARVRKHRAAAAWIERLAGDRVTDHAEILAHHYGQALQLARAAGLADDTRELEAQARRFLIMAGDRALEFDARKAEAFYRQALELCPPRHADRARLLGKAAEAALVDGRLSEAQRDFEEAIAEFRARGETVGAGEAMVRLARTYWFRGETDRKRTLLAQAIELLEREPPGRELALAYTHTAADHMVANRSGDCVMWSEKALALAQAPRPRRGGHPRASAARARRGASSATRRRPGRPPGSAPPESRPRAGERDDPLLRKPRRLGVGRRRAGPGPGRQASGYRVRGAARTHPAGHVGQGRDALASVRPRALGRALARRRGADRVGPATGRRPGDRRRAHVHGVRARVSRRARARPRPSRRSSCHAPGRSGTRRSSSRRWRWSRSSSTRAATIRRPSG